MQYERTTTSLESTTIDLVPVPVQMKHLVSLSHHRSTSRGNCSVDLAFAIKTQRLRQGRCQYSCSRGGESQAESLSNDAVLRQRLALLLATMRLLLAVFAAFAMMFAPVAAQDLCPANSQDTVRAAPLHKKSVPTKA